MEMILNQPSEFDRLEAQLLDLLQRDASMSVADIAEATNSSAATCWRRIRDLEAKEVLGPPVRLVDPKAVGRGMDVFCQVRMKSQDEASQRDFKRAVDAEPAIVEVYSISGDWDYLLHLLVRDIEDLEQVLMKQILKLDCVAGTSTLFVLRRIKHTTRVPV